MATPFPIQITAAQVGTYFVGQYYQVLQQQPEYVHQFFGEASTMIRIDGLQREAAAGMLQIHSLIMSLSDSAFEIKTAHSLESWNGGVLVIVSGSVQVKKFSGRRKFVQTFFLAPQEKGYFVLNDIFHFIEDESIHLNPAVLLVQNNFDTELNVPTAAPEPVSKYSLGGDIQTRGFSTPDIKENGHVEKYNYTEQCLQQVAEAEHKLENSSALLSSRLLQNTFNSVEDQFLAAGEEPQKQTYASILRVAKRQAGPSMALQPCGDKNVSPTPLSSDSSQGPVQQSTATANTNERSRVETTDEVSGVDYEGEIKSVYVRNLLPTMAASEIAEEFKKFGKLSSAGAVIRGHKDLGICYAFVEFEDMESVCRAVKAGSVQVAGRQLYIEGRRANSNIPSRGGRRGRGRGSYQSDPSRGQFGSNIYGRWNDQEEYNRPKGNGFYRPSRQDRGFYSQQPSKVMQNLSESTS